MEAGSLAQPEEVLRGMHKALAHDLPNQIVALQGLLQLLDQDESAALSPDGREFLMRLHGAARRTGALARFLKEMAQVPALTCKTATIVLDRFALEVQGELQRLHPDRQLDFRWNWHVPEVVGDARILVRAVTELFVGLLSSEGQACRIDGSSQASGTVIRLEFQMTVPETSAALRPIETFEQRMEIILARAWLSCCGASVEFTLPIAGAPRFCITLPIP
jgi:light-regulated signal transduction histidine kinase (bacteriophytochrome)